MKFNKKGFTLVEIIVCIIIIALIGTLSTITIVKSVDNKGNLLDYRDMIVNAAEIYIETNDDARNQLYNNKNVVYIPLRFLVNDGLLDFTDTNITDEDIDNNYVMKSLTMDINTGDCVDIKTFTSFEENSSHPIYICPTANSGLLLNSNQEYLLVPERYRNDKYYIEESSNYIKYEDKMYQILYVTSSSQLVLVNRDSFDGVFEGKTDSIDYINYNNKTRMTCDCCQTDVSFVDVSLASSSGEAIVDWYDIFNDNKKYVECERIEYDSSPYYIFNYKSNWDLVKDTLHVYSFETTWNNSKIFGPSGFMKPTNPWYKVKLKSCMKISSGIGSNSDPYILTDEC